MHGCVRRALTPLIDWQLVTVQDLTPEQEEPFMRFLSPDVAAAVRARRMEQAQV